MRNKQFRVCRLNATMGIAVLVILLLAMPMSLALAQGADAEKFTKYAPADEERDYNCIGGATGQCIVQYADLIHIQEWQARELCDADECTVRVELRW